MKMRMVVEVIPNRPYRLLPNKEYDCYYLKQEDHLFTDKRGFKGYHGWIDGFGEPPNKHLDAVYLTKRCYNFSDKINCKLIGAYKNHENYEMILVDMDRDETSLSQLDSKEKNMLCSLYDEPLEGENWLEAEEIKQLIEGER